MNVKKYVFLVLIMVSSFLVLAGSILTGYFLLSEMKQDERKDSVVLDKPKAFEFNQKINVLLLGTDGSELRSDVMMLVSLNPEQKSINILSIPRDTRVKINHRYEKINAALAIGKEELAIRKVKEITGMPIHYYVKVNFKGFRNTIDILGGVDFEVPVDMDYDDPYQNLHIHLKKGMQHLDGKKAEQLVRFRRYPDGDIGRVKTQQAFVKALIQQKMKIEYLSKINELYAEVVKNVETNFNTGDVVKNLGIIKVISADNINLYRLPGEARMINGISYYIHNENEVLELIKQHFGY